MSLPTFAVLASWREILLGVLASWREVLLLASWRDRHADTPFLPGS